MALGRGHTTANKINTELKSGTILIGFLEVNCGIKNSVTLYLSPGVFPPPLSLGLEQTRIFSVELG